MLSWLEVSGMKIMVVIEISGKKDTAKVWRQFDLASVPSHRTIVSIQEGPQKRLNDNIPINVKGLSFRVDAHNIIHNLSSDIYLIETVDETSFESNKTLKELLREYLDCGWEQLK
jgi:hypothetical protein